jgi:hypothetical protein
MWLEASLRMLGKIEAACTMGSPRARRAGGSRTPVINHRVESTQRSVISCSILCVLCVLCGEMPRRSRVEVNATVGAWEPRRLWTGCSVGRRRNLLECDRFPRLLH